MKWKLILQLINVPKYFLYSFMLQVCLVGFVAANDGNEILQGTNITGKVLSGDDNSALPGVNIIVKGTSVGTVTDLDGNYALAVPDANAILVFSSVGYVTYEVAVGARTVIDITLAADVTALSEIVVVGYGTQERAKVTGAISSVSAAEITQSPIVSLDQALQGKSSGVYVVNSGAPGQNPVVRIRGITSTTNSEPLYVIDGVPAGGLNTINPNDIESIEILKDAATSAIYGSRGSNGVIMVTTKRGKSGKPQVQVDAYYGTQQAWNQLDLLDREEYLDYGAELQTNGGQPIPARFSDLGEFANVETDWQDALFRTAAVQDYNISIGGGNDNSNFMISTGYFSQDGIIVGTNFERYSFRANSDFQVGKILKIGESLMVAYTDRQREPVPGGRSLIEHTIKSVPYIPVYDDTRVGGFRSPDKVDGTDPQNAVLQTTLKDNPSIEMKVLGNIYADVTLGAGFSYRFTVGVDMSQGNQPSFLPMYNAGDFEFNETADIGEQNSRFFQSMFTNQLNYAKQFGDHNLSANLVYEVTQSSYKAFNAGGENATTSEIGVLAGTSNPTVGGNESEYALISYLARINYDYKSKYLLTASMRRDGGSRFGDDSKWGNFPSVSVGWRLTEEAFLSGSSWLSDLKLRGSYGELGNDRIGDYNYIASLDANHRYNFNGASFPGTTISALANAGVQWETKKMTNVGVDMGMFNDKLTATLEWFSATSEDLLLPVPIPHSLGLDQSASANVGETTNEGFEFSLGYHQNTGAFQWSLDANASTVKNEFTDLGIGQNLAGPGFEGQPVTYTEVGQPIAYYYGYVVEGIYQSYEDIRTSPTPVNTPFNADGTLKATAPAKTTAPGDIKFKDIGGAPDEDGNLTLPDGKIDANDRTNIGHYLPDLTYGLNFNATWKNFDMNFFLQGVSGNEILNTNIYDLEGMTRLFNSGTRVLDRWTTTNTETDVPRAVTGDPNNNARLSTRYIEDGSYMRIKNLTIGYSLPTKSLEGFAKGAIKNLRIYITGTNLLTITDYSGYDPEIGIGEQTNNSLATGVDYGQYPQPRTFIGGIKFGF